MIVGILGTGTMAQALTKGMDQRTKVLGFGRNRDKNKAFSKYGILVSSIEELYRKADVIVFAVKPQNFDSIPECRKPVVSMMAGIPLKKLKKKAKGKVQRIMPSLSIANSKGAILRCGDRIREFENAIKDAGTIFDVDEKNFHELSLIAGSMPALLATFLLSLKAAIKTPLSDQEKTDLIMASFTGVELDGDWEEILQKVASPGGITEAFLKSRGSMEKSVRAGLSKSTKRSKELSRGKS